MKKISAAIITFNEEKNLRRCLESLKEVADEIVVIDSFSTDKTEEIALEFGARFIKNPFKGHIEQKNFAISQASYSYVLSLDADEALSEELKQSILAVKKDLNEKAYSFFRRTRYVDQWIYHCGWYPDEKVRLFDRNFAYWGGHNPHDIIHLKDGVKAHRLKGDLLHYSYNSVSEHIEQTHRFTSIAAKVAFDQGVRTGPLSIFIRTFFKFLRDYFFKRGFLEGHYGLIICMINSLSVFLKYTKIYELQRGRSIN